MLHVLSQMASSFPETDLALSVIRLYQMALLIAEYELPLLIRCRVGRSIRAEPIIASGQRNALNTAWRLQRVPLLCQCSARCTSSLFPS